MLTPLSVSLLEVLTSLQAFVPKASIRLKPKPLLKPCDGLVGLLSVFPVNYKVIVHNPVYEALHPLDLGLVGS